NSLSTLGWTSPVVAAVPPGERAALVERLEMRVFDKGDVLVRSGEEAPGLHLIVSGEVAIVAKEWGERVLLATLGPGDTVGEMELVLCRRPFADALATQPTAALFLSRSEYASLIQDHPAILHGLYAVAVQRQSDTNFVLDSAAAVVSDDWLLDASSLDAPVESPAPVQAAPAPSAAPPQPAAARKASAPTLQGLGGVNFRAEIVDSKRDSKHFLTQASARQVVEPSARRTLPPPPLPRTSTPPPSSLSPSATTVHAPSLVASPRTPWLGVTAVMGMTAVAASVITVLAIRGTGPGASAAAAAQPPPTPVEALPPVAPSPSPVPVVAAPVAMAPVAVGTAPAVSRAASVSAPAAPVLVAPAAAAPAAPPADIRKPAVTTTPAYIPAKALPVATVSRPPQRMAAQPAAAAPVVPAAVSAADDEFGGRQ
ncbi:MAG: cyclic nucleotide-binding domain-containing protein, partial [Polyangiaceae bacterium]